MKKISSAQNPRLKAAIRLKTSRGRKTQQRIIVFGHRELIRAIESGITPLEVFLSSDLLAADEIDELQKLCPEHTLFYDVPGPLMDRLKYGDRSDGAVAIAQRPEMGLDQFQPESAAGTSPLLVILESIEKPGNIGAVLRSVDAVAASGVILADPQCDVLHPNCIRASMGSAFTIPLAIATADETLAWCQDHGISVFSLTGSGSSPYTAIDWTKPAALVFGSEARGLSATWLETPCQTVAIPMSGISDSLNISVAAGIALFEAQRQRQIAGS